MPFPLGAAKSKLCSGEAMRDDYTGFCDFNLAFTNAIAIAQAQIDWFNVISTGKAMQLVLELVKGRIRYLEDHLRLLFGERRAKVEVLVLGPEVVYEPQREVSHVLREVEVRSLGVRLSGRGVELLAELLKPVLGVLFSSVDRRQLAVVSNSPPSFRQTGQVTTPYCSLHTCS